MKAKVIATGEIVNVIKSDIDTTLSVITRYIYKEIDGVREWYDHELFFDIQEEEEEEEEESIDWEQRRFELVKAALQGWVASEDDRQYTIQEVIDIIFPLADAIIAKLKEE